MLTTRQYGPVCVAMLSTPLKVAPGSTVPIFLEMLLGRAVELPSSESIRPVYQVLSGLGYKYLDDSPLDVVVQLQEQLTTILAKHDPTDPLPGSLCLGVLALFVSIPIDHGEVTQSTDQNHKIDEGAERYSIARRFFSNKKAQKTLDVTVFRAIDVCSGNSTLNIDRGLEILNICMTTVHAISIHDKRIWAVKNQMRIDKLLEKMSRADIDQNVQCMVGYELDIPLLVTNIDEGIKSIRRLDNYLSGASSAWLTCKKVPSITNHFLSFNSDRNSFIGRSIGLERIGTWLRESSCRRGSLPPVRS